ncbi:MAG TPA: DUF3418 domain-containing protein, partial [Actinomycetes bacterium]|nr:DUF3418 domain-containing protein [Actinomycetes bacterium]
AADDLIAAAGGPAWDQDGFRRLYDAVRGELADVTLDVVTKVERVLGVAGEVESRLADLASRRPGPSPGGRAAPAPAPAFGPAVDDMRVQLDDLVYPGWVTATGRRRLPDVERDLRAMVQRLDKLPGGLARDTERMDSVAHVTRAWYRLLDLPPATRPSAADLASIRWMLEELRVSYFAQTLGTTQPVSEKRVLRAIDKLMP